LRRDNIFECLFRLGSSAAQRSGSGARGTSTGFGFALIRVGNNPAEVIEAVIDGLIAFRNELITPAILKDYLEKKKGSEVPDEERKYFGLLEGLLKECKNPGQHFHPANRAPYRCDNRLS